MPLVWLAPSAYAPHVGGIEELTARLGSELNRPPYRSCVVTMRWPADLAKTESINGIAVHRLSMPAPGLHPAHILSYLRESPVLMRDLDVIAEGAHPDIVHAIGASWQAYHLNQWARNHGVPFVLTLQGETAVDDHQLYKRGLRSVLIRTALRSISRSAQAITACSQWALDDAAKIAPALNRGVIVPNGISIAEFADVPPPPLNGPALAYGRLVPSKGFDLLLDAWDQVDHELWIGGDGPIRHELIRRAQPLGARVRFLGLLNRVGVKEALRQSRVVVMPSRLEPFGIVALEAMAAGRPVVASSLGGAGEYLAGGLRVDPTDTSALVLAVNRALARPELGLEGRAAAELYDWRKIALRYAGIYEELMS